MSEYLQDKTFLSMDEDSLSRYGLSHHDEYPHFADWAFESFYDILRFDSQLKCGTRAKLTEHGPMWLFRQVRVFTADQVPDMLVSEEPPTIEFFKSLPNLADFPVEVLKSHYMHYIAVLEHPTDENAYPYIIVGSCSNGKLGSARRVDQWLRLEYYLPLYVTELMNEGFEIVHVGALTLIEVPTWMRITEQPLIRCYILKLETSFTFTFWSVYQGKGPTAVPAKDKYMAFMCPWAQDELEYKGLSSHSPVAEHVRNIELTPEQLLDISVRAKQNALESKRRHRAANKVMVAKGLELIEKRDNDYDYVSDTDDEKYIRAADHHFVMRHREGEMRRPRQRKQYAEAMDAIKRQNAGELNDPDTEDEKALQRAQAVIRKTSTAKQRREEGQRLLKLVEAGKLENPTPEQEQALTTIRNFKKNDKQSKENKRRRRLLMEAYDAGKLENPTPEDMEDIAMARNSKRQGKEAKAKFNAKKRAQKNVHIEDSDSYMED